MVKKILQDIIPSEKRSIRHIPLPKNKKTPVAEPSESTPFSSRNDRKRGRKLFSWLFIIVIILFFSGVIMAFTWLFSKTTVVVVPKQATSVIDTVLQTGESISGNLPSTIVTYSTNLSEVIPSNKEEMVSRKASGEIVIYNNYSNDSQRLIKNTRFEASDGKIYRIDSSVVVPGQKVEDGKKIPGSITATVYADAAGPEYNLKLSDLKGDFTIPGFKGTPRYSAFYARQKTDIVGGFNGLALVVDPSTLEMVEKQLKLSANEVVWNNITSSLPENYFTKKSLYSVEYSTVTENNKSENGVLITVKAVGKTVAIDTFALSKMSAQSSLPEYSNEPIVIKNIEDITIAPRLSENKSLFEESLVVFEINGNAHFVWQIDEKLFKGKLAGKIKNETEKIIRDFPAIETAEVTIKPSWVRKYPKNPEKIEVLLKLSLSE